MSGLSETFDVQRRYQGPSLRPFRKEPEWLAQATRDKVVQAGYRFANTAVLVGVVTGEEIDKISNNRIVSSLSKAEVTC